MTQRISRGFHRLAIFLAAVPFLIGGTWATFAAINTAKNAQRSHDETVELVCAQTALKKSQAYYGAMIGAAGAEK